MLTGTHVKVIIYLNSGLSIVAAYKVHELNNVIATLKVRELLKQEVIILRLFDQSGIVQFPSKHVSHFEVCGSYFNTSDGVYLIEDDTPDWIKYLTGDKTFAEVNSDLQDILSQYGYSA